MRREPKLTFRIIRRCAFDCPLCSTFSGVKRRGEMRQSDFRAAMDILATCDFRGTLNVSGGETTLHGRLCSMLRYASVRLPLARIAVFTNGDWVGRPGWRRRLRRMLAGPNVLVRFSLDRQHAQGAIRGAGRKITRKRLEAAERNRLRQAGQFLDACLASGAKPGVNFDFAFKGTADEARAYMRDLGPVPVYTIRLRRDPDKRPKEPGFFAVDAQENGSPLVYPTLGHIPRGEHMGGLETLATALEINRRSLERLR